jgi:hypothetical protein
MDLSPSTDPLDWSVVAAFAGIANASSSRLVEAQRLAATKTEFLVLQKAA